MSNRIGDATDDAQLAELANGRVIPRRVQVPNGGPKSEDVGGARRNDVSTGVSAQERLRVRVHLGEHCIDGDIVELSRLLTRANSSQDVAQAVLV